MESNVYWTHGLGSPDGEGMAWVSAQGPVGSVAVGGGGWASIAPYGGVLSPDDPPFLPIVATKPVPTNPESWLFGVLVPPLAPGTAAVQIHAFVICLEDMP